MLNKSIGECIQLPIHDASANEELLCKNHEVMKFRQALTDTTTD